MRAVFVLGRAIFGGYFAWCGLNHFLEEKQLSQCAPTKGVAAPDLALTWSGALLAMSLTGGRSKETP